MLGKVHVINDICQTVEKPMILLFFNVKMLNILGIESLRGVADLMDNIQEIPQALRKGL